MKIGRYEIVRKIAAGGMCEIFLARDRAIEGVARPVALKRLFPEHAAQPSAVNMLRHEARVLAQLAHPGVPHVYELGRDGSSCYLAMEFVPGLDMAAMAKGGTLPIDLAITIVIQLLEALAHTHARRDAAGRWLQIVHRDVAPANVLVGPEGTVKLVDFGVATSNARPDEPGTIRGTPGYIAPEAVTGEAPVDHRADLFAVGVLLYEATLGHRLFAGNHVQIMNAVVQGDVTRPSALDPDYPLLVEEVIMQALAREPWARFASAGEMAAHLEAAAYASGHVPSRARLAAYMCERWFGADRDRPDDRRAAALDEGEASSEDAVLLLGAPKRK